MTKNIKSKIAASVIAVTIATAGIIAVSSITVSTPALAKTVKAKMTKISPTMLRVVRKQSNNKQFMAKARGAEGELEDCMNNPDNSHIEYIDRLGACFCLATDNASKGCQTAN